MNSYQDHLDEIREVDAAFETWFVKQMAQPGALNIATEQEVGRQLRAHAFQLYGVEGRIARIIWEHGWRSGRGDN